MTGYGGLAHAVPRVVSIQLLEQPIPNEVYDKRMVFQFRLRIFTLSEFPRYSCILQYLWLIQGTVQNTVRDRKAPASNFTIA